MKKFHANKRKLLYAIKASEFVEAKFLPESTTGIDLTAEHSPSC
jgi:hypothetical protein